MNKQIIFVALIVIVTILGWFIFRPVCVPLTSEDLSQFSPPIEQRTNERGMIYHFWQQKGGQWYQCKSAIEREFFF